MSARRSDGGGAEGVGGEPLLSFLLLESLAPREGSELEDATGGPVREQAEEIAQVSPGLQAVELAAGQQRHEGRVDFGGLIAADEEPIFPADRDSPFILPMSARL
jgi:hypothetical protein